MYPLVTLRTVKGFDNFSRRIVVPVSHYYDLVIVIVDSSLQRVTGGMNNESLSSHVNILCAMTTIKKTHPVNSIGQLGSSMRAIKLAISSRPDPKEIRHILPPICPILSLDLELVRKRASGRNRALSDPRWTVHPGSAVLEKAMPVETRAYSRELVLDIDDDCVSFVGLDGWAGILTCNANNR
jgi:hypothetical protein